MNPEKSAEIIRNVPFFRFLDFSIVDASETEMTAHLPFAERHIGNPVMNFYHGGIVASFMEALASLSVSDSWDTQPPKPINLTVDYLRPAVEGDLRARARVTRKGKRMASVTAVIWQEDEAKPVAQGLYHFLLV